ncbi:protein-L-isoaspartate O-methyltransferase [Candidatus Woesebacteria bacterium RBG_19FT_COMBO_47_8]|uniref:Protein-L-isoaspartate O-methyltransferase n=1 Tax=Candidatus Woesebacteria bacterium RBG_13_46_13 TaxID=1802479 RepID=A0A1F7X540_9BACT|nr:MAG: protein-L-isoaspartate O-methyltransferase [Candidatus Woesebacteria bacterium RBG_13_46_13]OGM17503.1 MAG: protein-L-isoaspartate O-methyltransferase [Candidatus Woesebacteria bacterium RBG_19FT_COMBO_47_8]HJX59246.1 protein-L-isoaspartate(D-aspartate) O-methyltransferase [Patescibacteria group bacterium]
MNRKGEMMVGEIREKYGLKSPQVLAAMLRIPREEFIADKFRKIAYSDGPVPIGHGQTISQPYTVAFMTDLLGLKGDEKVLEVGTGSGYQAALLSLLAGKVFTVERIDALSREARKRLRRLGYKNVEVKTGSGEYGWNQEAPYDAILVTAGLEWVPEELFRQLKDGGVLVAPVGRGMDKVMIKYSKRGKKIIKKQYGIFHFVPFVEE